MTNIREEIEERFDASEMMFADGFDDCIIGVSERCGQSSTVVYDIDKVLAHLIADGMTADEALEYYYFNIVGAWVGEGTPTFVWTSLA